MASNGFYQVDGSYNKAPVFHGEEYAYWKKRMRIFICSHDLNVWIILLKMVPLCLHIE